MEGDTREGTHPNTRGERTSFGSDLNSGFESGETGGGRVRNIASTVKGKAAGTALVNDPGLAAVTDTLASGMRSSADWLRDADLDKLKEGVEKQVKEHPARALLVALGAGFLIGKVLRR